MKRFDIYLNAEDFAAFRAHPATRLYTYRRKADGDTTIWATHARALATDLEKAIDFGATTALEVING